MGTSEGTIGDGAMVWAVMFQIDKGTEGGTAGTEAIGLDAALALFVLDDRDGERSEFFDGCVAELLEASEECVDQMLMHLCRVFAGFGHVDSGAACDYEALID